MRISPSLCPSFCSPPLTRPVFERIWHEHSEWGTIWHARGPKQRLSWHWSLELNGRGTCFASFCSFPKLSWDSMEMTRESATRCSPTRRTPRRGPWRGRRDGGPYTFSSLRSHAAPITKMVVVIIATFDVRAQRCFARPSPVGFRKSAEIPRKGKT